MPLAPSWSSSGVGLGAEETGLVGNVTHGQLRLRSLSWCKLHTKCWKRGEQQDSQPPRAAQPLLPTAFPHPLRRCVPGSEHCPFVTGRLQAGPIDILPALASHRCIITSLSMGECARGQYFHHHHHLIAPCSEQGRWPSGSSARAHPTLALPLLEQCQG